MTVPGRSHTGPARISTNMPSVLGPGTSTPPAQHNDAVPADQRRCGFQTGNIAQLGIAIARNFDPVPHRTYHFMKPDQQAFVSLLSFLAGTSLGRIGDRIGPKRRNWLVLATFLQCLMTMAGALCAHFGGESQFAGERANPSWTNPVSMTCLGFISATIGLQGIMGKVSIPERGARRVVAAGHNARAAICKAVVAAKQ